MIGSRIRPLLALFALGTILVLMRMFEIQVGEHGFWRAEAARLVHSGREIPYRRGEILDAAGRVLARDKDTHDLVLVYREFRRGHPLGQVAHARSLLESRAIDLEEARHHLLPWAHELLSTSPRALESFARGGALRSATLLAPAVDDPRRENRRSRALDTGFYAKRLLGLSSQRLRALEKRARGEEGELSFLELAALVRSDAEGRAETPEAVWDEVAGRIERSMAQLERLARLIEWPEPEAGDVIGDPLTRMVAELEHARRWVEDATAAKLFAEATGFAPGRIAPATLLSTIDLSWIARLMAWDDQRLFTWAQTTRAGWIEDWRDASALQRLVWGLALDPARPAGPDELLSAVASVFRPLGAVEETIDGDGLDWRAVDELAVFAELDGLFRAGFPAGLQRPREVLPIQRATLRARYPGRTADWRLFDAAWSHPPEQPLGDAASALLERGSTADVDALIGIAKRLAGEWDADLQRELRRTLEAIQDGADLEDLSTAGTLLLADDRMDRAEERSDFFLKDYGMRPKRLVRGEPSYEVIYLITRYEDDYAGFAVREARERDYRVLPGDVERPASRIIGSVAMVGVRDLLRQREEAQQLRELKGESQRTQEEEEELRRLVGEVRLHDEVKGVSGVEGFWNPELEGTNGYRESRGLEDVFGKGRDLSIVREPEDGRAVQLTLDTALQRAAKRTLQHPIVVDDTFFDDEWQRNPVGAVVILSAEGDVLAAYSEPSEDSEIALDARGQRLEVRERTLRIPTFQPPGSVFKPFVAVYALDRVGLDPRLIVPCVRLDDGGAGYVDVHCHSRLGHGDMDLDAALIHSCNSYFAWLGETLTDADLHAVAEMFGFGQPTGVLTPPAGAASGQPRSGLIEDVGGIRTRPDGSPSRLNDFDRRRAGNGLSVVQATPMQVARAMLALGTGELTDLRLVERIGDEELPRGARHPLPLSESSLERVRAELAEVAADPDGTAWKALRPGLVGFPVAVKTGSADYTSNPDEHGKVRKHTWVAGWAPADDPAIVFTVFVHNTYATSSHGAVYLARELLHQPEVLAYLEERGVDISRVEAR